jgi:hypothetical protein
MKKFLNNGFFILFLPFACTLSACKHSLDADLVYGEVKIVYSTDALNNLFIVDIDGQNNFPLLKLRERGIDVAWFPNVQESFMQSASAILIVIRPMSGSLISKPS